MITPSKMQDYTSQFPPPDETSVINYVVYRLQCDRVFYKISEHILIHISKEALNKFGGVSKIESEAHWLFRASHIIVNHARDRLNEMLHMFLDL